MKKLNNKKTAATVKIGHVKKTAVLETLHEHNFHQKTQSLYMFLNKSIAVNLVPLMSWWGWGRGDDMLLRKINTIDGVDNENKLQEEI